MKWFLNLFGNKKTEPNSEVYVLRNGELTAAEDNFQAWTSGNLDDMLSAAQSDTNLIDRHFLLQSIVAETYKRREDEKFRGLCVEYSEKHINEFSNKIATALKDDMDGYLPRVSTFQYYATLLTELGDFKRAIEVCENAISYGLSDGTKSGFQGRIDRIKKKASLDKL